MSVKLTPGGISSYFLNQDGFHLLQCILDAKTQYLSESTQEDIKTMIDNFGNLLMRIEEEELHI